MTVNEALHIFGLNVGSELSLAILKKLYRKSANLLHTDHNVDGEADFKLLNEANALLKGELKVRGIKGVVLCGELLPSRKIIKFELKDFYTVAPIYTQ